MDKNCTDGFVLEIEKPEKTCIICKRYTKNPIITADGKESTARIMDIIVDDMRLKTSEIKNLKPSKVDGAKLVLKVFKNEDTIIGVEKINLDDFPPKVKYKINILPLMHDIFHVLNGKDQ